MSPLLAGTDRFVRSLSHLCPSGPTLVRVRTRGQNQSDCLRYEPKESAVRLHGMIAESDRGRLHNARYSRSISTRGSVFLFPIGCTCYRRPALLIRGLLAFAEEQGSGCRFHNVKLLGSTPGTSLFLRIQGILV